jgi:regulation of enolase protein 1 (concanavalin A-like superfamily)
LKNDIGDELMAIYNFVDEKIPDDFFWFNEPDEYYFDDGLNIITNPETDFWQGTHYGFRRDDGHCLLTKMTEDFSLKTQVHFEAKAQYDQCGLFARLNRNNWIKCSVELENKKLSRLGSVVTNLGFSDWATQDISADIKTIFYRMSKENEDFLLEYSFDDKKWIQMRIAHLHEYRESVDVGLYACSPVGKGFRSNFKYLEISENVWHTK